MRIIAFFVFAFCLSARGDSHAEGGKSDFTVCFFELGNQTASDNLISQTGADETASTHCTKSSKGPRICRYPVNEGEKPHQAMERMIQDGQTCDGLSFSGHHAGDWYGEGDGTLYLKKMEDLACQDKYRDWFSKIKALWLDGCNTVTDDSIAPGRSADSESTRVLGKVYTGEKFNKLNFSRFNTYQQSYAGSLDENTKLSSRYLRMFPHTRIYGFNGPAPLAEDIRDKSWIYNHLIRLGRAMEAEESFENVEGDLQRGLQAIFFDDFCNEAIEKWEHGANRKGLAQQDYDVERRLGCQLILAKQILDSPDTAQASSAAIALAEKITRTRNPIPYSGEVIELAKAILDGQNTPENRIKFAKALLLDSLNEIEELDGETSVDKKISHLLFNNLYDTWNTAKKYKESDSEFFNGVQEAFKKEGFTESIKTRITSTLTASLKKGDYIKFYTEIHDIDIVAGTSPEALLAKQGVQDLLSKANSVFEDLRSSRETLPEGAKRALAVSVVHQLLQYGLLSEQQISDLAQNEDLIPRDTKNIFFIDTHARLAHAFNPDQAFRQIATYEDSLWKERSVRSVAGVYLSRFKDEGDTPLTPSEMEGLNHWATAVRQSSDNDIRAGFTDSLYNDVFRHKTPEQQIEDFLKLRAEAGPDLEGLLVGYFGRIPISLTNADKWLSTCKELGYPDSTCEQLVNSKK